MYLLSCRVVFYSDGSSTVSGSSWKGHVSAPLEELQYFGGMKGVFCIHKHKLARLLKLMNSRGVLGIVQNTGRKPGDDLEGKNKAHLYGHLATPTPSRG